MKSTSATTALDDLDVVVKPTGPLPLDLPNLLDIIDDEEHRSGAQAQESSTADLFAVTPEMLRERRARETSATLESTSFTGQDSHAQTYRYVGCMVIGRAAKLLRVPQIVVASARAYFHRFYCVHAWDRFDVINVARCCLFLAGKAEEHYRKVRDVINCVVEIVSPKERLEIGKRYWAIRDEVVATEAVVLRTLDFDLSNQHPYLKLMNFLYSLGVRRKDMYSCSLAILNDSFFSTMCLTVNPTLLALASIYVAAELLGVPACAGPAHAWWEAFDVAWTPLEGVIKQLVEVLESTSSRNFEEELEKYKTMVEGKPVPKVLGRYKGMSERK